MSRPSIGSVCMSVARAWSERSTCDRRHVGCLITTTDGHTLSTGYNGSAPGAPHCDDVGHLMHDGHCVRTVHAEANAIAHAARMGVCLNGGVAWCTHHPCPTCLLLLASAGVTTVWYSEEYHEEEDAVSAILALGVITVERWYDDRRVGG